MRHIYLIIIAFLFTACGSGIPSVKPYKLEIQQGNVVTSKMLLQLRPGMTQSQVRYIMGTPLLQDSFHSDRWDYFYQMRERGRVIDQRRVILRFENNLLDKVAGDVVAKTGAGSASKTKAKGVRTVQPSATKAEEKGFFDTLKFWKKSDEAAVDEANQAAEAARKSTPTEVVPLDTLEGGAISIDPIESPENDVELLRPEEESGWLDNLKFWDDDEDAAVINAPVDSIAPVETLELKLPEAVEEAPIINREEVPAVEMAEPNDVEESGWLDKLKFWGDDAAAEEGVESLSGVEIKTLPEDQ